MFEENAPLRPFKKTTKQVIKEVEELKDIEISKFNDAIENAFDRYNVDGVEDLVGFDAWPTLCEGKHELNIKVDHEDAYEFTIYTTIENNKATVTNVL